MTSVGVALLIVGVVVFLASFALGLTPLSLPSLILGMAIGGLVGLVVFIVTAEPGFVEYLTVGVGLEIGGFLLGKLVKVLRAERKEMQNRHG